jgi:HSP20 family protein
MARDFPRNWMWSEAVEMLARVEQLHHELFRPQRATARLTVWEPPVDVLETEYEVLVLVALPGVNPDRVEAVIEDDGTLLIAGIRAVPPQLRTAVIHRLELPQGRFERRVRLPAGRYSSVRRTTADGCLVIALDKLETFRG